MNIHPHATRGHLIAGGILIALSLGCFIASLFLPGRVFPFLIFFFGVWGGVETGRYLEAFLARKAQKND
jgi:hypothetical protein